MAMFKVKVKITSIHEGIIEEDDKAAATAKLTSNMIEWWALRTTVHDSNEVVEVIELTEEDPG